MLYHLLAPLGKQFLIFNLLNYISFRLEGASAALHVSEIPFLKPF